MDKANLNNLHRPFMIFYYALAVHTWLHKIVGLSAFMHFLIGSLPYKLLANSLREAAEVQYNNKFVKYF